MLTILVHLPSVADKQYEKQGLDYLLLFIFIPLFLKWHVHMYLVYYTQHDKVIHTLLLLEAEYCW